MRIHILTVLCALASLVIAQVGRATGTLTEMQTTGPRNNRANIVFLSEGYTSDQSALFLSDAANMISSFFAVPHNAEYKNYFNVFAIFIASNETGSDHPSRGIYRDTYFSTTYDSYGIARLITIGDDGNSRVYELLAEHVPEYDLIIMIVNDTEYGGSGGLISIASVNASSAEIALHEIGHSFGGLTDEYEDPISGSVPWETANSTAKTTRSQIVWNPWIDASTPVPTPKISSYATVIGLFEGCQYQSTGWYRPKQSCKMRSLDVPFCAVCSEAHVKSMYNVISGIDGQDPTNDSVTVSAAATTSFAVNNLVPSTHELKVQWYIGTNAVPAATKTVYSVAGTELGVGVNTVMAEVWDDTVLVRNDPNNLLRDVVQWNIEVIPSSGASTGVTACADYDGDGKADPAIYNETNGTWKVKLSSENYYLLVTTLNGLGGIGYASVLADYDGDRLADPAVYQESSGAWTILKSSLNYAVWVFPQTLGGTGYSGMPADYDGDRLADPGVYERNHGDWKVLLSSAGYYPVELPGFLGGTGYMAVADDYDGDRLADPAIYGESDGYWIFKLSSIGYGEIALTQTLGDAGYLTVPADFDGDGKADPAVRSETSNEWIIMFSSGNYTPVHVTLLFD